MYAPSVAWVLLSQQTKDAGIGALGNPHRIVGMTTVEAIDNASQEVTKFDAGTHPPFRVPTIRSLMLTLDSITYPRRHHANHGEVS